jgi:hypothetical protein
MGVSGRSARVPSCVAVGDSDNGPTVQSLVESWNGTAWSIVSSPNQGPSETDLEGVSCISSNSCVAVGYYYTGSVSQTLVESWNGSTWSIVSSPNASASQNQLSSVTCTAANKCTAVGFYVDGSTGIQNLIESWNGTAWSIVSSPDAGTSNNFLNSVDCTSGTNCTAVGYYLDGSIYLSLIEAWNGTTWSIDSSPNQGSSNNFLTDVSCAGSTKCVAVGYSSLSTEQPLVETLSDGTWSVTSSAGLGILSAVSCTTSFNCIAVGRNDGGTLAEIGPPAAPTILALSPTSGAVGSKVTISGTNLLGATKVTFNGKPAIITKDTAGKIKVVVPPGATTGRVQVSTAGGSAKSASSFTVT